MGKQKKNALFEILQTERFILAALNWFDELYCSIVDLTVELFLFGWTKMVI